LISNQCIFSPWNIALWTNSSELGGDSKTMENWPASGLARPHLAGERKTRETFKCSKGKLRLNGEELVLSQFIMGPRK